MADGNNNNGFLYSLVGALCVAVAVGGFFIFGNSGTSTPSTAQAPAAASAPATPTVTKNITTAMVARDIDEMKLAGLTPTPCKYVKAPRVAESPVALECKYWKTIELPVEKGYEAQSGSVVFGQVVGVHIDDSVLKDGRVDVMAFRPVARLGYSQYTTTENVWSMRRPDDPRY